MRAEFPLLDACVYLNSNSAGATPRGEIAALIHAPAGSVICDANVSTLFSRVLSCFDYRDRERGAGEDAGHADDRVHGRADLVADATVARELIASGFICSYRGGLRIAPHFYNTDEEVDLFMGELVQRIREAA